jgi:hypothetical protein
MIMKTFLVFVVSSLFSTHPALALNDDCVNAVIIPSMPSLPYILTGDTTKAKKMSEGYCGTYIEGPGLWYKLIYESQGETSITVSTCNEATTFDTKISVFKGDDCGALECIGGDDDAGRACDQFSSFTFLALEPATYWIFVHGYGAPGKYTLTIDGSSNFLALVDSQTDKNLGVLGDLNYQYHDLSSSKLNIQAIFNKSIPIASVRVNFLKRSYCEKEAPYSIFGDVRGDFRNDIIPLGSHVVTATPYATTGCQGSPGIPLTTNFDVFGCDIKFYIYDTSLHSIIAILDDSPAEIPILPCKINIEAVPFCGFDVESVKIELRDIVNDVVIHTRTERAAPYFIYGDTGGKPSSGSILPGEYTLTATIDGIVHPSVTFSAVEQDACI